MKFTIPSEFEVFIEQALASGKYRTEAEVFFDAVRLLRERERKSDALRLDIEAGLEELDRGEKSPLDMEDVKRRGRQRLSEQTMRS